MWERKAGGKKGIKEEGKEVLIPLIPNIWMLDKYSGKTTYMLFEISVLFPPHIKQELGAVSEKSKSPK